MRISRNPTTVMTSDGEVQTREEATVHVKELDLFVRVMLLEETPAVLSLGEALRGSCVYILTTGPNGQKPQLTEKRQENWLQKHQTVCTFVVPGLSTSSSTSSTPASSTSSARDSVFGVSRYMENPATERSGSTSEELRGNPLHRLTETKNTNKNEGHEEVQSDLLHELPDWLQEFRETFGRWKQSFRATVKSGASTSRHFQFFSWITNGVASKSGTSVRASIVSTHTLRKAQYCDICLKTNITRLILQKTCWYSRAQSGKFWWFDNCGSQLILREGNESRKNHRYVVVVQDLATQWLQSFPLYTKTSQETQKSPIKFLEPDEETKSHLQWQFLQIYGKFCEELSWNHCTSTLHRSETNGIAERAVRRVKEGTSAVLLQSGLEEWMLGMDSMECCYCYLRNIQDLLSWWEDSTLRKAVRNANERSQKYLLELWSNSTLFLRKDLSRVTSIWSWSLAKFFPRLCIVCGWKYGKETLLIADIEEFDVNADEQVTISYFHVVDGTVKISRKYINVRWTSDNFIRDRPRTRRWNCQKFFEENQTGSLQPHFKIDSTLDHTED